MNNAQNRALIESKREKKREEGEKKELRAESKATGEVQLRAKLLADAPKAEAKLAQQSGDYAKIFVPKMNPILAATEDMEGRQSSSRSVLYRFYRPGTCTGTRSPF